MINTRHFAYFVLALVILLPLLTLAWPDFLHIAGTARQSLIYIIVLLCFVFVLLKKNIYFPKYLFFYLIFIIYTFVVDYENHQFVEGSLTRLLQLKAGIVALFLILLIIENTHVSTTFIKQTTPVLFTLILLAPFVSIIQFYRPYFIDLGVESFELLSYRNIYQVRRYSFFILEGGANALILSFFPLVLAIGSYYLINKKNNRFYYILFFVAVVVALSNLRTAIIGLLITGLIKFSHEKTKPVAYIRYIFVVGLAAITFFTVINYFGYDLNEFYEYRLDEGPIEQSARFVSYKAFLSIFSNNALFGVKDHYSPIIMEALAAHGGSPNMHIGYFNVLITYGITGGAFLFGFLFLIFKQSIRRAKQTNYWGAVYSFIILFIYNLFFSLFNFFYAGFVFALILEKFYVDKVKGINH